MKLIWLLLTLCLSVASTYVLKDYEFQLQNQAELDGFENELAALLSGLLAGTIDSTNAVVLNGYVDRMFGHVRNIVANDGFNTIPLPKESFKAKHAARGDIHHGSLSDLCTIYRTDNVIVALNREAKTVTLQFPFKFNDLKVKYDFEVKSLIFKTSGGIQGNLNDVKFHPILTFNYNTDTFTLDHYDMKDTGKITVKFSGHKLVDWLINAISKVVTKSMHPHIVNEIQKYSGEALQKVIQRLNVVIHKKLHPSL